MIIELHLITFTSERIECPADKIVLVLVMQHAQPITKIADSNITSILVDNNNSLSDEMLQTHAYQ